MKWLAAGAGVVVVVLVILLRDVLSGNAPAAPPPPEPAVASRPLPQRADARPAAARSTAELEDAVPAPAWPDDVDAGTTEFRPRGEQFFQRVDEYPRQRFPELVVDCYAGGEYRKAKLKLHYRLAIEDHIVRLRDITVVDNTFKDPKVTDCMIKALEAAQFEDLEMPDFVSPANEPETILIRPQALKRFLPAKDD